VALHADPHAATVVASEQSRSKVVRDGSAGQVTAEHGVVRRHPQVAPRRQLEAAGHGPPLDRGDDGFRH